MVRKVTVPELSAVWTPRRNVEFEVVGAEAGVVAGGVGVPDLDRRARDRRAGVGVDDREVEAERCPRLALGDVAADGLAVDVVRAFGHLRREHTRGGRRTGRPTLRPTTALGDDVPVLPDDDERLRRGRVGRTATAHGRHDGEGTGTEQAEGFTSRDWRGHRVNGGSPSLRARCAGRPGCPRLRRGRARP